MSTTALLFARLLAGTDVAVFAAVGMVVVAVAAVVVGGLSDSEVVEKAKENESGASLVLSGVWPRRGELLLARMDKAAPGAMNDDADALEAVRTGAQSPKGLHVVGKAGESTLSSSSSSKGFAERDGVKPPACIGALID